MVRVPYVPSVWLLLFVLVAWNPAAAQSYLNFESGHVRPLALSARHDLLFAVNTPDNRLEIFRVTDEGLTSVGEVVTGLEPVAVQVRGDSEAWVVNHLSDSVSVVDVSDPARPFVKATLQVGDEPRDLVFAGLSREKAFVTTAHRGQNNPDDPQLTTPGVGRADVWVFDTADPTATPQIVTLFADTPRALAVSRDGSRVYAAAFHSGNQTTTLASNAVTIAPGFLPGQVELGPTENVFIAPRELDPGDGLETPGMPPPLENAAGESAPATGLIVQFDGERWLDPTGRDWTPRVRFTLPDKDVFVIDATQSPPAEIGAVAHVGTILFNMAVHPISGDVYVSNLESFNRVRFEPALNGRFAENRVTIVDSEPSASTDNAVVAVHLNPHIDPSVPAGPPEELSLSLSMPLDMAFSADGERLYVAAFGSAKVAVLNDAAEVVRRIDVGGGPSGLALDENRERLYVMNRFDQTISIVSTRRAEETAVVPLRYSPEPEAIRDGRPLLYDARNSGHGDSSCASCHIFGDLDSLAWDLGDPNLRVEENPLFAPSSPRPFHPMKGPMATQSFRGLSGAGAMHWRGDRNAVTAGLGPNVFDDGDAFLAFRQTFQDLLGKPGELPMTDMERFRDFVLTIQYPPNPVAPLDDVRTGIVKEGEARFHTAVRFGDGSLDGADSGCASCHVLPLGTNRQAGTRLQSQDFKVPHLRNLYQKVGMFGYAFPRGFGEASLLVPTEHLGEQIRGFGYLHDGSIPTLVDLMMVPSGIFPLDYDLLPGAPELEVIAEELTAFLLAFDTGLAPAVGQQVTLDVDNLEAMRPRFELLRSIAEGERVELVVHGRIQGEDRGLLYLGAGDFQSDRAAQRFSEGELLDSVRSGDPLTFTAVYAGGGGRIALDRDEDGVFNLDQTDAADPGRFVRGDCNGDGVVAGVVTDAVQIFSFNFLGTPRPDCLAACDANGDGEVLGVLTDGLYILNFNFRGGLPPPAPFPDCGGVGTAGNARLTCGKSTAACQQELKRNALTRDRTHEIQTSSSLPVSAY